MPQYIDCYFLIKSRDRKVIHDFLDFFLPIRKESWDDLQVPMYANNPEKTFDKVDDLIKYLVDHDTVEYSLYWQNEVNEEVLQHAMVFFTTDGKMILGLSITGNNLEGEEALHWYNALKHFTDSDIGYITVEEAPPYNSDEFVGLSNRRFRPD